MTATRKRQETMLAQYEMVKCMIDGAEATGYVEIGFALDNAVAKRLVLEGYDVTIIREDDPRISYSIVNWNDAEEGRKGQLLPIDRRKQKGVECDGEKYCEEIFLALTAVEISNILDILIEGSRWRR